MKPEHFKEIPMQNCCYNCANNSIPEGEEIDCEKHKFFEYSDAPIRVCNDWE